MPPGHPVGPPPQKPKSGLIAALIIVGILVLGGGGVGIYFLTKSDDNASNTNPGPGGGGAPVDKDDPKAVAERFASVYEEAVNSDLDGFDVKSLQPILCGSDYDDVKKETERTRKARETSGRKPSRRPASAQVDIGIKDFTMDGDKGSFNLTWTETGGEKRNDRKLLVQKDSGHWVVCGLYEKSDSGSTSSRKPTSKPSR